jgi:hypothetical protein
MGVLEDAIREHLDLKRLHGASDEELTQQEAEALGPARRDAPEEETELVPPEAGEEAAVVEAAVPEAEEHEAEPPEPEPPEAALPSAGPEAPPAPADQDTVMYAPGEAPVAPEEGEDPDFGAEPREHKQQGDLDFD